MTFNHSILAARDHHESARFLAEILGLAPPTRWGPFAQVQLDGGVTIQFAEPPVDETRRTRLLLPRPGGPGARGAHASYGSPAAG